MADEHKKELAGSARARPLRADAARFARNSAHRALLRRRSRRCIAPSWSISSPKRAAIPSIAKLVRDVLETGMAGVTEVIARAPEMRTRRTASHRAKIAELIFAAARGSMMRDVLEHAQVSAAERRERQLKVVRQLWRLLFDHANQPALA